MAKMPENDCMYQDTNPGPTPCIHIHSCSHDIISLSMTNRYMIKTYFKKKSTKLFVSAKVNWPRNQPTYPVVSHDDHNFSRQSFALRSGPKRRKSNRKPSRCWHWRERPVRDGVILPLMLLFIEDKDSYINSQDIQVESWDTGVSSW